MCILEDFFANVLCVSNANRDFKIGILVIIKKMPEKEFMKSFWLHAKETLSFANFNGACDEICKQYLLNPNLRQQLITKMQRSIPSNAPFADFWKRFNCSCYGHVAFIQYVALIKYGDLYSDEGWKVITDIINSDMFKIERLAVDSIN